MAHDLLAELAGYESELAGYKNRPERAADVRKEIERVGGLIVREIDRLLAVAEGHEDEGRDVPAARARIEAKRLAAALPEGKRPAALRPLLRAEGDQETAVVADATTETATPKRARQGKEG